MVKLETELSKISGIGSKFLNRLAKLQIKTVKDLLWHFPFRYEDFSKIVKIADLEVNQAVTIQAIVKKILMRQSWRRRILIVEAVLADETGLVKSIWFNQPYVARILRVGTRANFAGKVTVANDEICLSNPTYELPGKGFDTKHTARLVPIYPETKNLTSKGIRFLTKPILAGLEKIPEFVPAKILKNTNLPEINLALRNIHFPENLEQVEQARKRFAFENLFLLQLHNLKVRHKLAQEKASPLKINENELGEILNGLPFQLTDSQTRSVKEILSDIGKEKPMNRLLQGDVGSGKTVVAAIAALVAVKNNKQAAFMAPTEVLSRQHYRTLTKLFRNFEIGIGLLTGSEARSFYGENLETKCGKEDLLASLENGKIKIIIGTHSLITSDTRKKPVIFNDLALAIVDEQHRFGVEQRAALLKKEKRKGAETSIHFLSMSATPIPRTLSLTIFGDLDLSLIDELPRGRKPIITKIVAPENQPEAYQFIRDQVKNGRQTFFIYPRIDPADNAEAEGQINVKNNWNEVKAVKEEYEKLSKQIFPDLKVAMLHSKIKSQEKERIMSDFAEQKTDILVATSVIEVGVDIPNATIMVIEGVERFGLAQLYQFRGRVGRGEHQSFCFLFSNAPTQQTQQRLQALLTAKNGFELAEKDLTIRGPGQFLGDKQTGLPDLAMRSLNNLELIKMARSAAVAITKENLDLRNYPDLHKKLSSFQKEVHLE